MRILAIAAVVVSVCALVVATIALNTARRIARDTEAMIESRDQARSKADRVRSGASIRGLAQGVTMYAREHGSAPARDGWQEALIDGAFIAREMLEPRGGSGVGTPYHYIEPTPEQIAAAEHWAPDAPAASIVLFYEDPALWGDGGHVAYLDTHTVWLDAEAYRRLIDSLGSGD